MKDEMFFEADSDLRELSPVELVSLDGGGFWKDVGKLLGHYHNLLQENMDKGYSVMEFMGGA